MVAPFPSGHLFSSRDVPQGVSTKPGWEMYLRDYSLQLFLHGCYVWLMTRVEVWSQRCRCHFDFFDLRMSFFPKHLRTGLKWLHKSWRVPFATGIKVPDHHLRPLLGNWSKIVPCYIAGVRIKSISPKNSSNKKKCCHPGKISPCFVVRLSYVQRWKDFILPTMPQYMEKMMRLAEMASFNEKQDII